MVNRWMSCIGMELKGLLHHMSLGRVLSCLWWYILASPLIASSERVVARPTLSARFDTAQISVCKASGALDMQIRSGIVTVPDSALPFFAHLRKMGGSAYCVRPKILEVSFAWLWEGFTGNTGYHLPKSFRICEHNTREASWGSAREWPDIEEFPHAL